MKKYLLTLTMLSILFLFAIILIPYSCNNNDHKRSLYLLSSLPEKKTYLYAKNITNGNYEQLILKIKNRQHAYEWVNMKKTGYMPDLYYNTIYKDGKLNEHLIVILYITQGTEVLITEAHVIDIETFCEIKIEDPVEYIKNNSLMKFVGNEVEIETKKARYTLPIANFQDVKKNLFLKPVIGSYIKYNTENENLVAYVGVQISPSTFVGAFKLYYVYDGKNYVINNIEYYTSLEN